MDVDWMGIDAGKEIQWAHLLDSSGRKLLSRKVENDEANISELIGEVLSLAEEFVWAVDQPAEAARHSCWRCCGSESRRCSTSRGSH